MGKSLFSTFRNYLPAVTSGILVTLSFPYPEAYLLAWVAFIPFVLSLWNKDFRNTFTVGFVFGMTYFFGTLYWIYHSINHYGGFSFATSVSIVTLLCSYLSLFPAIFAVLVNLFLRKTRFPVLIIAPVIWVVLEYTRSYLFTGFPWSSIGYSQYRFLEMIQIADITGIYGVSFLILAFNGMFVDIFLLKKRLQEMPLYPTSYTVIGFICISVLLVGSFLYGIWRLDQERNGRFLHAAVVQGNIEQDKKWSPSFQSTVMDKYFMLTDRALSGQFPDIVVWPETAIPFYFGRDREQSDNLIRFVRDRNTFLLFGTITERPSSSSGVNYSNSAILLDNQGKTVYKYDKIHLVPFGEYVPLRSIFFFLDKLVFGIGDYLPGREYITAETKSGRFATLICYEIIFPGMVRKFFTGGGDYIVTITNDAWFGRTAGPFQHFSMAVFRAIENRKPVIRSANTGISGFIDSNGRIISTSGLFEDTVLTQKIKTDATSTFYTLYGDLFSYVCIVAFAISFININRWR